MFDQLEMFRTGGALASHAALRQSVASQNIAQADTPGYEAQRVTSFADTYGAGAMPMRATRPEHFGAMAEEPRVVSAEVPADPNGNTVSIEAELGDAAMARIDHDMALGLYRHGLTVLRASIGRR